MIPFQSFDGEHNLCTTVELQKLEKLFGPASVVVSSYQAAISCILEALGSSTHLIPCILPVTASPDTIAGVLRSGADPILLDIRPSTLQMDPNALATVLAELKAAVVILTQPAGQSVDPELLELCKGQATILDSRLLPVPDREKDCVCSFNVFELGPVIGSGAVIFHKYIDEVKTLKVIRNGFLGHAAALPELLCAAVRKRLFENDAQLLNLLKVSDIVINYQNLLREKLVYPFENSPEWPYFVVRVKNANLLNAHMHMHGIEVAKPVYPLHFMSELHERWKEQPSYPVAEDLSNKLIALPVHCKVLGREEEIVNKLLEIEDGTT